MLTESKVAFCLGLTIPPPLRHGFCENSVSHSVNDGFSSFAGENRHCPRPFVNTRHCYHESFWWFSSQIQIASSHACAVLNTQAESLPIPWVFSLFSLLLSVLKTLAASISSSSQLCPLNSSPLGSAWFPLPTPWSGNILQAVSWGSQNSSQRDGTGREEEGGSGWGTHVYLWWIHVDIWQNQYNIVKLKNEIK